MPQRKYSDFENNLIPILKRLLIYIKKFVLQGAIATSNRKRFFLSGDRNRKTCGAAESTLKRAPLTVTHLLTFAHNKETQVTKFRNQRFARSLNACHNIFSVNYMENNVLLSSLAMDLKRVALSLYRKSYTTADRFSEEATKRRSEIRNDTLASYMQKILNRLDDKFSEKDPLRKAEDALMISTLIQNYVLFKRNQLPLTHSVVQTLSNQPAKKTSRNCFQIAAAAAK